MYKRQLEVDGDDVYIGGHFRYLVGESAPTPYGTEIFENGGLPFFEQFYIAALTDEDFVADLVDPGFVFPVNQI